MRLLFIILITFCLVSVASAQAPQGINYQGVARGLDGQPLSQKEISVRISVLHGSANGEIEYNEIHEIKTNSFGLFTLVIGQGTPSTSTFNFIGWTNGTKWLQIELDENGGRNFKLMGSQQLMSVPYALFAERSGNSYQAGQGISIDNNMISNIGDGDTDSANELITSVSFGTDNKLRITDAGGTKEADLSGLVGAGQNLSSVLSQGNSAGNNAITNLAPPTNPLDAATKAYVDNHTDGDASATNEIQTLSKTGSTLSLSNGGGSVVLADDDPGNELQTLSTQFVNESTRSLSISDGNVINIDVTDADGNATNEAQTLSRTGSNLSLSSVAGIGGGMVSIDDADANPTNEAQTISRTGNTVTLTNVSGIGGGSFTVDADETNELQNLSQVLTLGNNAGGNAITNIANPTNTQDAATKYYVDAADALINARISATYAFKTEFSFANLSGSEVDDQQIPFTILEFDSFGVLVGNSFTADEDGVYVFIVEGTGNITIGSTIRLSILFNGNKYPIPIPLPAAGSVRYASSMIFSMISGQTVSLVGDNIPNLNSFAGRFSGFKL